jgi:hypothetical protein
MKKLIGLTIFLLLIAGIVTAQVTDSTATATYTFGDSFLQFLTKNGWILASTAFFLIDGWLAQTGKVKEGSILAWVLNLVGKIIRKKTEVLKTKKADFMTDDQLMSKVKGIQRRSPAESGSKIVMLIFAIILSGVGLNASAQKTHPLRWYPFNKTDNMDKLLKSSEPVYSKDSTFYFAPAVSFDVYTRGITTGNHSVGAIPGIGYNLIYKPATWKTNYLAAIGLFASAEQDKTNPDIFTFEVTPVLSLLNWIKLGYGYQWNFGGKNEWVLRIGIIKSL